MAFISYAQNLEDLMLWRALRHVHEGFYIDVGANHPTDDSVTRAFYDRGWRGINIEPLAEHHQQLAAQRPRDLNLRVAVGATEGTLTLFDAGVRGLATGDAAVAARHRAGGMTMRPHQVPLRPLQAICKEHADGQTVHFLKIDVEGMEADVLAGIDWQRCRPWLVLIEATMPGTAQPQAHWEPQVLAAGYELVWFDGLNRFYLASEQVALRAAFSTPPNVLDGVVHIDKLRLMQQLGDMVPARDHEAALAGRAAEIGRLQAQVDDLRHQLAEIQASRSWRWTGALRRLRSGLRKGLGSGSPSVVPDGQALQQPSQEPVSAPTPTLARTGPHPPAPSGRRWRFNQAAWPRGVAVPRDLGSQLPDSLRSGWLRLMGHVEGHYSLAMVNRSLALALDDAMPGRVSLVPCDGEPYQWPAALPVPAVQDATLRRLCASVAVPDASPLVSIVHHYPLRSDPQAADLRCAIFFWEESVVPPPTIAQLNDGFDAVFVASRYVRKVLIDSGCRLPVVVIPLGLDAALLADEASAAAGGDASLRSLMPAPGGVFRFLHVSSAFPRKGVDALLAAYFATFTAADAVELCIKTFANPHNTVDEQLAGLRAAHPNPPRVVVDDQPRDPAAMGELYRSAQAVVLPTRGEGFNLPAAEALALGLPLIVTGHGGQSDFCTLDTACLLPFSHARSGSHLASWGSCWVEPDVQALADALKAVREQVQADDPALMSRRRLGREQVLGLHTAPRAAHAMLGTLEALWHERSAKAAVTRGRVALLSSWQAACGVADFAAQRVAGLVPSAGWELRVFCDERARPPVPGDVHEPSWRLGDQASVMSTLERIGREGCEVVIVQHQPAFFTLDAALCKQLAAFQARGAVVIVELHAVAQIVSAQRLSQAAVQALRRVARIVVHQVDDLNLLLAVGLSDNVTLLPLGVPEPWLLDEAPAVRQELKLPPDALVMASFGFAYPHKGIEALVRAIRPLTQALGRPVRLLSLNAAPNPAARGVIAEAQAVAQELGVAGEVVWINDFLPLEQSRRLLSASDCVVFPYGPTRESASAAVGIGLASLRPVLVSREPIFDEVRDIAWPMEGVEADAIVSAVVACQADAGALQSRLSTQRAWLADNSSRALAARLADMVAGLRRQHSLAAVLGEHWVDVDAQAGRHQLFVDVSELFHRDARTGIQRVVRSLLARLQERPPSGYRVLPVWGAPSEPYRHTRRFTPEPGFNHPSESEPVQPQPGDVFLGLDLSAHLFPDGVRQLEAMHRAGVQIHYVIYDIIPISHPQWTAPGLTAAFVEWLRALAAHADALHCISAAVAQDVRGWMHVHAPSVAAPDIDHFMLGADIEGSLPSTGMPAEADALLAQLRQRPVFLMVGTLEPRKGHGQVMDAFELLWRMGEDVQLLIVGKQGWQIDALAERLRAHPEHGNRLHWVEGASDEYLQRLYGAANCLVAASYTEGFGLPLIEAARRGLPILARDIPVFREVAAGHASYFTGAEPSDIAQAVCIWLERAAAGATVPSTGMPWLTWQDSAEQLLRCMGFGADEPPEVPIPQPIPQS